QKIVAQENTLIEQAKDGKLSATDNEKIGLELFARRADYLPAARIKSDVPLGKIATDIGRDDWYRIASGKGVLVLHELRKVVGAKTFAELMDAFGRQHAGKEASAADFRAHAEKAAGGKVKGFFDYWLNQTGLPVLELAGVERVGGNGTHALRGT